MLVEHRPRQLAVVDRRPRTQTDTTRGRDMSRILLPPSLNVSISRVQNFAHNISIPMDKDKNKGVGGWVESWWIV
jgi:hypothetical protein